MNNYLLQLLKEVKTIIIPGLGALTLTNEHTGEMMFMSYLKFDDGNLAKHIAEKEGIDINDAKNLIAKFVREVTAQLDKGDSYDMYQFGTFRKVDGEVSFDQWGSDSAAPTAQQENVPEPKEEPAAPSAPEPIAETPFVIDETPLTPEENSIREELPTSETEAMGASIAAAVVADELTGNDAPVMEELKEEKREEANTAIAPDTTEKAPVIELTDKGFDTQAVPAEPVIVPETVHETRQPVNEVPPETKHDRGIAPSPKDILEAQDAKKKTDNPVVADIKQKKQKEKTVIKEKKKTSPFVYIIWGVVALILGAGTYVAINYDSLKNDFPMLAGNSEPVKDEIKEDPETAPEVTSDTITPEEAPAEVPVETIPAEPEPVAPPVEAAPAPPAPKPSRPRSSSGNAGNSSVKIGQPDPAKPFHIVGGSFSSESNAKRFARSLISQGQPSVMIGEFNGMYRVSISSFASKDEALQSLGALKSIAPQAWVFKWP